MANFDPTCIKTFQAGDRSGTAPNQVWTVDTSATYAMLDAAVLAEALAGLTTTQQAVINGYRYTPTATDYSARGFPSWAGNDPPAIYFKVTGTSSQQATALQTALAKEIVE